jgi:hypothetical protein
MEVMTFPREKRCGFGEPLRSYDKLFSAMRACTLVDE